MEIHRDCMSAIRLLLEAYNLGNLSQLYVICPLCWDYFFLCSIEQQHYIWLLIQLLVIKWKLRKEDTIFSNICLRDFSHKNTQATTFFMGNVYFCDTLLNKDVDFCCSIWSICDTTFTFVSFVQNMIKIANANDTILDEMCPEDVTKWH